MPKLIAQMIVKNEENRYLEDCLESLSKFCSKILIVDDASTDNTPKICSYFPKVKLKVLRKGLFSTNEAKLRTILWEMVQKEKPEWVLSIDADEVFDISIEKEIKKLMTLKVDWIAFKLCDMWNEKEYRIDGLWSPIFTRLFRFQNKYFSRKRTIHCGNIPQYINETNNGICRSDIRIKHLGWIKEEDKRRRSAFYIKKTKENSVNRNHADSIFETPTLKEWKDKIVWPKILITSLIRNRELCLKDFLEGLKNLKYPKKKISFYFIINDSVDNSEKILKRFYFENRKKYRSFDVDIANFGSEIKEHDWDNKKLSAMTYMRNTAFKRIKDNDYIFSIDSDIFIRNPNTLKHLVRLEKEVISEVFWARWGQLDNEPLPNVWIRGGYEVNREFLLLLKRKWVYRIGGLGAITLISKSVVEKGINYDIVKNLPSDMRGEDRHFCIRCEASGVFLWADTFFPPFHFEKERIDLNRLLKEEKRKSKITLALVTMIKNEEEILEDFLLPIKSMFDEIIFVDTGSTDRTIEIGKKLGAKIYRYPLDNNYAKARNFGLKKAKSDWIFQLDPDEMIQMKDMHLIFEMIKNKTTIAYLFRVFNYQLSGKPSLSESYRLFKNLKSIFYYGFCHETIENSLVSISNAKVGIAPFLIHHRGYLKGNDFVEKKLRFYEKLNKLWINSNPVDAKPYFNLGLQYLNDGKAIKGIDYLKRAIKLDPHFYRPRQELGFEYIRMGKAYLEEVTSLLPLEHPFRRFLIEFTRDLEGKIEPRMLVGKAAIEEKGK